METQNVRFSIDTLSVLKVLLILVGVYVLYLLKDIVLVVLTAVVIASAIEPAAKWFMKYHFPRTLAVVIIYLIIAITLSGLIYFLLPSLLSDSANFLSQIPDYIGSLDTRPILEGLGVPESSMVIQNISNTLSAGDLLSSVRSFVTIPGGAFRVLSTVFGGVFSFVLMIVLSFYLTVRENGISDFLRIITPHTHIAYVLELWKRSQRKIGQWMQGQLLLMLLVGVLVYLGLTILGVKHAFLFAVLSGLFEVIPLFGPILSSIPAVLVGYTQAGLSFALLIVGLFVIIQQFENHLIYPLVVNKVVGVPAIVVILALVVGAQLGGFLGALLSVPLAAVLMELIQDSRRRALVDKV
ncbi:MAG: AI-2E family transporter [Candidatus Campbellbacteria bacterium]|nr:AI-2E family transporter [Candidatus Campbellbacteria bacterium]